MATNYSIDSPNTGASAAAKSPGSIRKLWQKTCDMFEEGEDFFSQFEGTRTDAPVQVKTDTSKGRGQEITFTVKSGLYAEPHHGDELFHDDTHFEAWEIADYSLKVDVLRHATRFLERYEELLGMRGEFVEGVPEMLGKWMGRQKTEKLWMAFREKGNAENTFVGSGRATIDDLQKDDTLKYSDIVEGNTVLRTLNGKPATVGRVGKNRIKRYIAIPSTTAGKSLRLDAEYQAILKNAGNRGDANYIFTGGYSDVDGTCVVEHNDIDHDGVGAIGSPINAKASLGQAIASATTTQDIFGGGNTANSTKNRIEFYKWFPQRAYKFIEGDSITPSGDDFYVVVYNLSGADKGKWGFYRCDTNNGQKLTTKNETGNAGTGAGGRLAAAVSGTASTKIGDVVWDAAKNTEAHPEGSLVLLTNKRGIPYGYTLLMGACAARRGYGKFRNKRGSQSWEDGFVRDVFVRSYFGQEPCRDRMQRRPGYVMLVHALKYPGVTIDPSYS